MPHLIIEYSANLDGDLDIDGLLSAMHQTATTIDALPIAGIRTRAARRTHYKIADGDPSNTFINVTLRIAAGRSLEVRKNAGETLFAALLDYLSEIYESIPMSLSLEVQEIDPETRWKHGNIRQFMATRRNSKN